MKKQKTNGHSNQLEKLANLCRDDFDFHEILNNLPEAVYLTDANGCLTFYNKAAVEFSGREPELGSDHWCVSWKLYHTDGTPMPHDTCPMAVALKEGRKVIGEEAIAERPDGKRIWFRACPSPLRNEKGEITGGLNMLINISRQKQDEEKLRKNERELDDFFENATIGLHWVGPDGIIKRVNQAELDMLGYDREEYVGRPIADFHADQDVIEDILQRLTNREELYQYEARLRCKDGSIRHVLISSNVYEVNGKFVHTRCFTRDITERNQAEQALLENEKRLSSQVADMKRLHSLSTKLMSLDDIEAAMREVMKASAKLMNAQNASVQVYDEQKNMLKLVGNIGFDDAFSERFSEIDADGFTTCAAALKEYKKVHVEDFNKTTVYTDFGKIATSYGLNSVLSTPVLGSDGKFFGVFSMYWDKPHQPGSEKMQMLELYTQQASRQIERKYAEEKLRKSEEKYRTLFDSIDEGFCILQLEIDGNQKPVDFRYLEANAAFEKHTGITDVTGKHASEVLPELEDDWFKVYGKVALTGEPVRFENYASQLQRWFNLYAFRIGEPQEKKVAVIFKDITKQKKAQEELENLLGEVKTEKERLLEIFNNAPSFMCILRGPDHVFERANDLYLQLVGRRELIGKPVREVFPDVEGQGFYEMLDQAYETGEAVKGTDMKITLEFPSGGPAKERYVDFVYQPLRDSGGKTTGIFVQGVDLTERRQAKEELQSINETLEVRVNERTESLLAYQEQLKSLASRLSQAEELERHRLATELHDNLGQILTICKMKLDQMIKDPSAKKVSSELTETTEMIDEAIRHIRQLMFDLKPPPSLDAKDIRLGVEWVIKNMEKHGMEISLEDDQLPKPLDEEMRTILLQAVRELLFNVVKHSGQNKAYISITRQNGCMQIKVTDEGNGFDINETKLVPAEEGGFGLFNIRERMDQLEGDFTIQSEPGGGTEALITAPLNMSNETEKQGKKRKEKKTTVRSTGQKKLPEKIKILIADDHKMMRNGLKMLIEDDEELKVIAEASDGREAVELAQNTSPDIIIMDVDMPGMNGIEAAKQISSRNNHARIIGLSLHNNEEVVRAMKSAGASAYVTKSEAFETLCETIKSEARAGK